LHTPSITYDTGEKMYPEDDICTPHARSWLMREARLTLAMVALGSLATSIGLADTIAARANLSGTLTGPS
jgi:hypothetical protein